MATITVRDYVLRITELLELILLQLDMRTLLISQRVCRKWNSLIRTSSNIQETLFFKPVIPGSVPTKVQNPLLAEVFPPFFIKMKGRISMNSFDMVKHPEKQRAYLRPEASWRRMLVQQPPAYQLGCYSSSVSGIGISSSYRELPRDCKIKDWSETEDGIRMEMLFEQLVFDGVFIYGDYHSAAISWPGISDSKALDATKLDGFDENPDILVYACSVGCCDEADEEDERLTERFKALYRELGLEAKWPPKEEDVEERQSRLYEFND